MAKDTTKTKDLKDEVEYQVTLTRTIEYKGIQFFPDGKPKMKGSFIKLVQADPKNEGAFHDYAEVPS